MLGKLRTWTARLHVGQLIILLVILGGAGIVGLAVAADSVASIRYNRNYLLSAGFCCDSSMTVNGVHYRYVDSPAAQSSRDTLAALGKTFKTYDRQAAKTAGYTDEEINAAIGVQYDNRLTEEQFRNDGTFVWLILSYVLLAVCLVDLPLLIAILWWWFGARTRQDSPGR